MDNRGASYSGYSPPSLTGEVLTNFILFGPYSLSKDCRALSIWGGVVTGCDSVLWLIRLSCSAFRRV